MLLARHIPSRGINPPPQTHHRASKILTVLEGCLEVGFVTSNPSHYQVLTKGCCACIPDQSCSFPKKCRTRHRCCSCCLVQSKPRCHYYCKCCVWVSFKDPMWRSCKGFPIEQERCQLPAISILDKEWKMMGQERQL